MLSQQTILTGIKPTGSPHLGNLVGAIYPAIALANRSKESYIFVADLHALNSLKDRDRIEKNTREIAAAFLAMGLDTKKTALFRQSDVYEVLALANILNNVTPKGLMNRSHAYKAFNEQNRTKRKDPDAGVNMGLYTYPILMAADILLYGVDIVPVGKDQKQHIEFTQEIARRFNHQFGGQTLTIPKALIQETANAIPGLDGRKMSKSYKNTIPIFENPENLRTLIGRIITDSKPAEAPKNPEESTIFTLYQTFATKEEIAHMRTGFEKGGMGYEEAKDLLYQAMNRALEEPRKKFEYYMNHPQVLDEILEQGAEKAHIVARKKLKRVTEKVLGRPMIMGEKPASHPVESNPKKSQSKILHESFLARAGSSKVAGFKNEAPSAETALDFQLLARDLANGKGKQKIVLTTGLGLSDQGVPLRLPSLIVPGLKMLRELSAIENADPHYLIYQARDFITDMNRLDVTHAFNNAAICTKYLENFVAEYFPDLKDRVKIISGDSINIEKDHLETLAQRLAHIEDEPAREDMKTIAGYASRRKTVENSHLYYAAANIILNGGYGPHYPLQDSLPEGTSVIIPMGGKKEKPFFNLTTYISKETGSNQKIMPLLVPVGKIPAYYPNQQGDILVGVEKTKKPFIPPSEIKGDFTLLDSLGITMEKLEALSSTIQGEKNEGQINRHTRRYGPAGQL